MSEKEIKFNIVPRKDIKITPKEKTSEFHTEFLAKVFNIEGKRIPFAHQKTSANCGPLSISNGVNALAGINEKFTIPKDFPISSGGIRDLLAKNEELRKYYLGITLSEEIKGDNYALQGEHISNVIKMLTRAGYANLRINVNRFGEPGFVDPKDFDERVLGSDWLILHKGYHYKSFVKLDGDRWVSVDSMNKEPVLVSKSSIENDFKTEPKKQIPMYMAMQIVDNKKIIFNKK